MSINGKQTFGAGRFFGINNVSNPTPMRARVPQDMSIDFKLATKDLYGENRLPVAVAAGELSVAGKVTLGSTESRMFADLIFGDGGSPGQILEMDKESGTVPAVSTYIIPVANSDDWTTDLGVIDAVTGQVLTCVASGSEAVGLYSVAEGIYTFASGDANRNVKISYLYTDDTAGETVALSNSLQGPAGAFTAVMAFLYGSAQDVLTLNNAIPTDSGIASKQGDFAKPTFGFMAATDPTDTLGTFSFAQAA